MPPIGSALLDPDVFALGESWRICWTLTVGGELVRSMASYFDHGHQCDALNDGGCRTYLGFVLRAEADDGVVGGFEDSL